MKKIIIVLTIIFYTNANAQSPAFQWAKSINSTSYQDIQQVVTDDSGNVFTVGGFKGTADFDPGPGTFNLTATAPYWNMFILKLDAAGNFVWAKQIGNDHTIPDAMAIDSLGNIIITGFFQVTSDFDPGSGTANLTSAGGRDIFILKLDASANFIWVKQIGNTLDQQGESIMLDNMNNIYIAGVSSGTVDFDPGAGIDTISGGSTLTDRLGFALKLDASGNFIWAKGIASSFSDYYSIAIDASKNVYISGTFSGTCDFDPGAGVYNITSYTSGTSVYDVFILKLDISGNFTWAKRLGGLHGEQGAGIAVDSYGNVYTTGYADGNGDYDPNLGSDSLYDLSANNSFLFLSKLDANGNFVWAKQIGGSGSPSEYCSAGAIALDASGNIYTTGQFYGTLDFDPNSGVFDLTSVPGTSDVFVSKINSAGNFVWAVQMGGTLYDHGNGLYVDPAYNVYTQGQFQGTFDFDPTIGTCTLACGGSSGNTNCFIQKLSQPSAAGIDQLSEAGMQLNVYPNPNNGIFSISINSKNISQSLSNNKIEVHNILGENIFQSYDQQLNNSTIDISSQPNGVYFMTITNTEGHQFIKKLVIQ